MEYWVLVLIAVLLASAWLRKPRWAPPKTQRPHPELFDKFEAVNSLFVNRAELAFFHALERRLPAGFYLLTKPRLEDVIRVRKDIGDPQYKWQLRGRIKSRHIDFVVINGDGLPCLAIELDGYSHLQKSANNADALKDGLFKAAQIPFYRIRTGENFAEKANFLVEILKSP